MNDIIKTSEFDTILRYITEMRVDPAFKHVWLRITIPRNLALSREKIEQYFTFHEMAIWDTKKLVELKGELRDSNLGQYIYLRIMDSHPDEHMNENLKIQLA